MINSSVSHPLVKEFLENINKDVFYEMLQEIGESWKISKDRIFLLCKNKNVIIPDQGWKIHVSTSLSEAEIVLKECIYILKNEKCWFKVVANKKLLEDTSQKYFSRKESGKFITIYPENEFAFLTIIEKLYFATKNNNGPYILTDKQYKDSNCVFYRYGSFANNYIVDRYGKKKFYIVDEEENLMEDSRNIPIKIPSYIKNPVKEDTPKERSILLKKYQIHKALRITNSGGVYIGKANGKEYLIKEARRCCCEKNQYPEINAISLLKNEYSILREFQELNICPKPIELIEDCGNCYLVEEMLDGKTLFDFVRENNPLYYADSDQQGVIDYFKSVNLILDSIFHILSEIEKRGYTYTDLSIDNIFLCKDNTVKLIDFEGCTKKKVGMQKYKYIKGLSTYKNQIIFLLFSIILKHEIILNYDTDIIFRTLKSIENYYSIDLMYEKIFKEALDNKITDAQLKKNIFLSYPKTKSNNYRVEHCYSKLREDFEKTLKINIDLLKSDISISKKSTSKYELGYGILGIDNSVINFNEAEKIMKDSNHIPIGLINGICGLILKEIECKEYKNAKKLILTYSNDKRFLDNYSFGYGLAGFVFCIELYINGKNDRELFDILEESLSKLTFAYKQDKNFILYEQDIPYGFFKGKAGIASVLLYASMMTNNHSFADIGKEMIMDEIEKAEKIQNHKGLYLPYSENDQRKSPYFSEGTAGLISVLIRYNSYFKEDITKGKLVEMIETLYTSFCIDPGIFQGMAGIGDTLIDLYNFTGNTDYYHQAEKIGDNLDAYWIQTKYGKATVSNGFNEVSFDYGEGVSGVIEYIKRLENTALPRKFFLGGLDDELLFKNA